MCEIRTVSYFMHINLRSYILLWRTVIGSLQGYFRRLVLVLLSASCMPAYSGDRGSGVLKGFYVDELKWHIGDDNYAYIDSVKIFAQPQAMTGYPCQALSNTIDGSFSSCRISRNFGYATEARTYNSVTALTAAQMFAFFTQTGRLNGEIAGPCSGCGAFFAITVLKSNGSGSADYLGYGSTGNGIPPTEVVPPLSCSLSDGTINHGTINNTEIDQHSASTSLWVSCTRTADVSIRATAYDSVKGVTLGGSNLIHSKVTIDGVAANIGVTRRVDTSSSVRIMSVLTTSGSTPPGGVYEGAITLVTTVH